MKSINPPTVRPPFARYSHAIEIAAPARLVVLSGQLGVSIDDTAPESAEDQAALCFSNIDSILAEARMTRRDVLRINAYVTDRAHMLGYMNARDAWLNDLDPPPASTLVIVAGFTRPEFKVEIEAMAASDV
ncbi:MAG: RidA family protein [Geminicoccales bacterium]